MKILFFIYCFLLSAVAGAQSASYYNWSGYPLAVYEQPSVKAKILGKIPVGQKVEVISGSKAPAYTIYLSYYGDTASQKKETSGEINNTGSFYPLRTSWVKITGKQTAGYVPRGFLSRIPPKALYQKDETDHRDLEISLRRAMKVYFGRALSYKKQKLAKQSTEEIHFAEHYLFPGKVTYTVTQQYVEKDGPGGEEHRIFLPNTSLHEAVLFLLEITNAGSFRPEEKKSVNTIKSRYDFFSWWYQPNQYDEKGNSVNDKNRIDFEYYAEGGSSSASFIQKSGGVEIVYAFGGC